MASVKQIIYKRLNEEADRSGLTRSEFVSELDKAALPKDGSAYQFGTVLAEFCALYNKETVCRIIRQYRKENRSNQ